MSQWTHVLGVIRFDSWNLNVYPEPPQQTKIAMEEVNQVHCTANYRLPEGSEGPIQVETIFSSRGPAVVITGDLRDFGIGNIQEILEWSQRVVKEVKETVPSVHLRDALIRCEVESDKVVYLIVDEFVDKVGNELLLKKFIPAPDSTLTHTAEPM